jgi:hypothetical protein
MLRRGRQLGALLAHADGYLAGAAVLHHLGAAQLPAPAQQPGRPDARVPGERDLGVRGEDAHVVRRLGPQGREGRLGQVELTRQGLQLARRQPTGTVDHGERVAGVSTIGEHVDHVVVEATELVVHRVSCPDQLNRSMAVSIVL